MQFCPRCGSYNRSGSTRCQRCGRIISSDTMSRQKLAYEAKPDQKRTVFVKERFTESGYEHPKFPPGPTMDIDEFRRDPLNFMKYLLIKEREKEKSKALKESVQGRVVDSSDDIVTIECDASRFEEGDVLSYQNSNETKTLGTVLVGGRNMAVKLHNPLNLEENSPITLRESEMLTGYDLQLELIDRINEGSLNGIEEKAVSVVLKRTYQNKLVKASLVDISDLRDKFPLDNSQISAVEHILGLADGELLLVIGPPGTGKTRVIAKAAYELSQRGARVLITSHTNRAVDNALELLPIEKALRVGRPERTLKDIHRYLLSYKVKTVLGDYLRRIEDQIEEKKRKLNQDHAQQNDEKNQQIKERMTRTRRELSGFLEERNALLKRESEELVQQARIIGSTLIKSQMPPLMNEQFDVVLIDECSQVSLTLALLGMIKAKRWVLIGDHKQLLPIFNAIHLKKKALIEELSIFCKMLKDYRSRALWLKWHYRSNKDIIGFSQQYIYDGMIEPKECCKEIKLTLPNYPADKGYLDPNKAAVFLGVDGSERSEEGGSKYNTEEAQTVAELIRTLKSMGVKDEQIGVITPFRVQKRKIEGIGDGTIEINTVDSFQGREKDLIIFSVTSTSDLSFVEDANRLNVALTRARKKLIVIGNTKALERSNGLLAKFLEYTRKLQACY